MTAIVKRPARGPVLVHLDYRRPPLNRDWLESGFRVDGYAGDGWWIVQRARTDELLLAILDEFGAVEFWVESVTAQEKCDIRCVEAKGWDCRCSCGGLNHRGTAHGWRQVGSTGIVKAGSRDWTRRRLVRKQHVEVGRTA
jgi:hypothetical protein